MTDDPRSSPEVTVICTVRNGGAFVEEFVAAWRAQTFVAWELVLVDDGSDDDTARRVEECGEPRIRLVRAEPEGRGNALNQAVSLARASLVAINDVDDVPHPTRLERQVATMRADDELLVLGTAAHVFFDDELGGWTDASPASALEPVDVTEQLRRGNPLVHSSLMVRTDTLRAIGGYDVHRRSLFDYDLYVRLAASDVRLHRLGAALVAKRAHGEQSFQARNQLAYRWEAAKVQYRALRDVPGSMRDWAMLPARLGAAMVPLHRFGATVPSGCHGSLQGRQPDEEALAGLSWPARRGPARGNCAPAETALRRDHFWRATCRDAVLTIGESLNPGDRA